MFGASGGPPSQEPHDDEGAEGDPCRQAHAQKQPVSESLLGPAAFCSRVLPEEFSKTFLVSRDRWEHWLPFAWCHLRFSAFFVNKQQFLQPKDPGSGGPEQGGRRAGAAGPALGTRCNGTTS